MTDFVIETHQLCKSFKEHAGAARSRPPRAGWKYLRLPRAQRRRQDDHYQDTYGSSCEPIPEALTYLACRSRTQTAPSESAAGSAS